MKPPRNVLLVIADQLRPDCLGAYGNPLIKTPHLDSLAAEGTLFSNCFVQTNPCGPSRMCLFTGRYLCSNRALTNETPLIDAEENLAMHLQAGGYNPALIGYNDYVQDPRLLPHGHPQKTTPCYDNVLPGFDWILFHDEDTSPEYLAWLREKGYPEEMLDRIRVSLPAVPPEGPGDHLPLFYPARYRAEDSEARFVIQTAIDWIRRRLPFTSGKEAMQEVPLPLGEGDLQRVPLPSEKGAISLPKGGGNKGWFLSLNLIKPHPPRICPAPYHDMYSPALMPPPKRRAEELTNPHPYYRIMQKETKLLAEHEWRETRANYYGMISEMDTCLGELFQFLKDSGEWEHTLILFTSDHGEYLGDHYLLDKAHFYDETMRVPLIIRDPYSQPQTNPKIGEGSPSRINGFCESIDLAPTILEFLGLPIPDRFQGTSLLPVVRGELPETGKGEIYFEADFRTRPSVPPTYHPDECLFWVVRDEKFKYVQFASADMPPILFDLQRDPGEFDNLAESSEYASVVAVYCQKLLRWRMRHEDQRMEHWAAIHRKR